MKTAFASLFLCALLPSQTIHFLSNYCRQSADATTIPGPTYGSFLPNDLDANECSIWGFYSQTGSGEGTIFLYERSRKPFANDCTTGQYYASTDYTPLFFLGFRNGAQCASVTMADCMSGWDALFLDSSTITTYFASGSQPANNWYPGPSPSSPFCTGTSPTMSGTIYNCAIPYDIDPVFLGIEFFFQAGRITENVCRLSNMLGGAVPF